MKFTLVVTDLKAGTARVQDYTLDDLLNLIDLASLMGDNMSITFTDNKLHANPHLYQINGVQEDCKQP